VHRRIVPEKERSECLDTGNSRSCSTDEDGEKSQDRVGEKVTHQRDWGRGERIGGTVGACQVGAGSGFHLV
jgi:hypothetical protein